MKKYTLHVTGTHCASCKILIEDVLNEQENIQSAKVDLEKETLEIETTRTESAEELAKILNSKISPNGYQLSVEKSSTINTKNDILWQAIPVGLFLLVLFFWLQKSGILNFGLDGKTTPTTSFIIGLVASVSSCLAIVGGLVLSLSAKISQDNVSDTKNIVLFHVGRIVSFAALGGVLGMAGRAVGINFAFAAILGIIASLVMLFLGLNLMGIFEKSKITLPAGIFNFLRKIEHKTLTPLIIGFSTFFLPCGFTQSMQVVAFSSGSFLSGMMIMLAFALGTLPVLSLLSFGSVSFAQSKYAPLFFKSAGVLVVGLGIFALLSGLAGLGIIKPIFNI